MRLSLLLLSPAIVSCTTPRAVTPDLSRIDDAQVWRVMNGERRVARESGRSVVSLAPIGGDRPGSNVALALVEGVEITEGTIDVDIRGGDADHKTFLGIAFDVESASSYEAIYFRPFNFSEADVGRRAHAVQYVSWPEHTWEALRREFPGTYEAAIPAPPIPGAWFHVRLELSAIQVSVFVDEAKTPCLVVRRLHPREQGGVGLWVDSQAGEFAGLRIQPSR